MAWPAYIADRPDVQLIARVFAHEVALGHFDCAERAAGCAWVAARGGVVRIAGEHFDKAGRPLCAALTRAGVGCSRPAWRDGFCGQHARLAAARRGRGPY